MTDNNEDLNKEDHREVRNDKPNFFSFKEDGKINKKFLKYEDGNIKYFRESKVGVDDIIDDGEQFIKRNIKNKTKKELVFYILIIVILLSPILLYAYYGPFVKNNSIPDKQSSLNQVNKYENNKEIQREGKPTESISNDNKEVQLSFEDFMFNIKLESNELHNGNIEKLESFFNKKSNKAGLRSTVSKNLKKQEDLYVKLIKGRDIYKHSMEIGDMKILEDLIVDDIYKTTQVLNIIDTNLKREYIDNIYK